MDLYLSATLLCKDLVVKGPITLSKKKTVEFFIKIPFQKFENYGEELVYILENICDGYIFILKKYKVDIPDIEKCFESLKKDMYQNSDWYKEWEKSK